ncbi:MAG TPA: SxtJ family membrane protein [Bryobacteraceae bacterium]|jgi:hypothetical protein|nr:SxtJ family membrane protein [Bryobacteraceae bacterium]
MAAVLLVIGFVRSKLWAVAGAALLLILALAIPSVLHRPKRAWLLLGRGMGAIVNPIILGFLFYLVITPAGLLGRLFGRDPLRLRPNATLPSYWRERAESSSDLTTPY